MDNDYVARGSSFSGRRTADILTKYKLLLKLKLFAKKDIHTSLLQKLEHGHITNDVHSYIFHRCILLIHMKTKNISSLKLG